MVILLYFAFHAVQFMSIVSRYLGKLKDISFKSFDMSSGDELCYGSSNSITNTWFRFMDCFTD